MNKRSTRFYRKNEAEVMERLGLKPTINSGAGWMEKEDGISEHFICQLKSTDKESMSIKQHDLHTLDIHASESHKLPVFAFQFLNRDEVWLAVKESDIEAIKRVIRGEASKQKAEEQVDSDEKIEYNCHVSKEHTERCLRSMLARKEYMEHRQKEAEKRREEMKEKIREKRRKQEKLWRRN